MTEREKIMILFYFLVITCHSQESTRDILEKTIHELYKIETVVYESTFEASESGLVYIHTTDSIFFDFSSQTKYRTPKHFLKDSESELIFDGNRHIQISRKEKLILTNERPNVNNPLMLTLYPIRVLLPKIIDSKNIDIIRKKDTVVNEEENFLFELKFKNGIIDWQKLALITPTGYDTKYTISINKADFYPRVVIMQNGPTGTLSRTFDNFDFKYHPDNQIWTDTFHTSEYIKMTFDEYFSQMKDKGTSLETKISNSASRKFIGNWKLPHLENKSIINLTDLKGNVVLLEFWFKYCGPCIKAVSKLNAIHQKYKNDNFKLFGIEFREDFQSDNLLEYTNKIKMNYPSLYEGKTMASYYGITAAPTIMILDKKGNIIYNNPGFNEREILKILEENL